MNITGLEEYLPELLEGRAGATPIRVITPPGQGPLGRYALAMTEKLVPWFEQYFGIPFPYPKLDLVGVNHSLRQPVVPVLFCFQILARKGCVAMRCRAPASTISAAAMNAQKERRRDMIGDDTPDVPARSPRRA